MRILTVLVALTMVSCYSFEYKAEYEKLIRELEQAPIKNLDARLTTEYFSVDEQLEKEIEKDDFSLETVRQYGLKNNPEILSALKDWKASLARYPQAVSLDDPMLQFITDENRLEITQRFPYPGKLTARGDAALFEAKSKSNLYYEKINSVIAGIEKTYYELSLVYKSIEINERQKLLLDDLQKTARAKYENAQATQYDVVRAQIRYTHLSHRSLMLKVDQQRAEVKLNKLLNRRQNSRIGRPKMLELKILDLDFDKLANIALESRPELIAAKYQVLKAEADLKLAKLEYIPDFTLGYMHDKEMDGIMAGINIPLQLPSRSAKVEEASANLEKARADFVSIRNKVFEEIREQLVCCTGEQEIAVLYRDSVIPQARQTFELATKAYENNQVDLLGVVDAQVELEDAELSYYNVIISLYKSLAEVKKAVGKDFLKE